MVFITDVNSFLKFLPIVPDWTKFFQKNKKENLINVIEFYNTEGTLTLGVV